MYLFCNLHTLKCKEKHPPVGWAPAAHQSGACVSSPRWTGGSSRTPERHATPVPVGRGNSGCMPDHTSKNDEVQSKKGQNYIPFLQSTYPEMQRKTSSRQSGTCAAGPRLAGGLWPLAREAHTPLVNQSSSGWLLVHD